jgi:pimeloyl-ACP methyl ester carboxylesterase
VDIAMFQNHYKIIFLPGLGADCRFFKYLLKKLPGSVCVTWTTPKPNESLEHYADRLSQQVENPQETIIVCGVSFGGMVAPYFAKRFKSKICVIISTVKYRKQFPMRYYLLFLLSKIPFLIQTVIYAVHVFLRVLLNVSLIRCKIKVEIIQQFISMKPVLLTCLVRMMFRWGYYKNFSEENYDFPIIHVHGERDLIIPVSLVTPDICIKNGGHCLPLSHHQIIYDILLCLSRNFEMS